MRINFLLAILFIFPAAANASDWTRIAFTDDQTTFMDFSSISKSSGYIKSWVQTNYTKPKPSAHDATHTILSSRDLLYFNCKERTFYQTQITQYGDLNGAGEVIYTSSRPLRERSMQEVVPDTIGERMLTVACSNGDFRKKIKIQAEEENRKAWGPAYKGK